MIIPSKSYHQKIVRDQPVSMVFVFEAAVHCYKQGDFIISAWSMPLVQYALG
jgi:hypothetical protein